jgi:hypothetical protein
MNLLHLEKTFRLNILYIITVKLEAIKMFVELVFDKRNVAELPGAAALIKTELTKRVHRIFPNADVRVKPMQANGLNTDASKSDKEKLNRMLEEMFDETDQWLIGNVA